VFVAEYGSLRDDWFKKQISHKIAFDGEGRLLIDGCLLTVNGAFCAAPSVTVKAI
jgi:hypothetical protein